MFSMQSIPVAFQEVWSNDIKYIRINPHWTLEQMIWSVKSVVKKIFRLENYDIDIVPINQMYNILHGIIPELGPKLIESNVAIRNLWGLRLDIRFFVRRKNYVYPQLAELNVKIDECECCALETYVRRHYECKHLMCETCYCKANGKSKLCPVCKSS